MSCDKETMDELNKLRNSGDIKAFDNTWLESPTGRLKSEFNPEYQNLPKAANVAILGSGAEVYDQHWVDKVNEAKKLAEALGMEDLAFSQLMDICKRSMQDPVDILFSLSKMNYGIKPKDIPLGVAEVFHQAIKEDKSVHEVPKIPKRPKDHQKQMRKRKRDQRKARKKSRK